MSKDKSPTGHKHDDSDRALDKGATTEQASASGPTHDPDEIRKHDDSGKDRLFEGRQQHDEAEKNSEKSRLAKDVAKHHHAVDEDVADSGSGDSAKRKS
ncbi:MAG: hypothetical protein ABIT20_24795 [Gemmatimonadaceae bacterium]